MDNERLFQQVVSALSLEPYLALRPEQLSGGLTQRVALARALVAKPRVLLMDEPFSALDWASRRSLQDLLQDIQHAFRLTVLLVTHQLSEAQRLADQIALIDAGRILQTGSPQELMTSPASWRAAQLLGFTALIETENGMFAVHPDRVAAGAYPDLGIVMHGRIEQLVWHEGRQLVALHVEPPIQVLHQPMLEVALPSIQPYERNQQIELTLIHPPRIG